ncbi:MAG: efflux RND transporter periplasmic adaptor subunit [Clostridia bacterium]|nr:efflux RND transporter periplasmic adaptor subunit [Clostridia bacterium]
MSKNGKPRKKRILRKILLFLVLLLVLGGVGLYAYLSLKVEYTVTYDSYTATTGSISNALSFSGNLSLVDSASYTANGSGTVRTLYVAAGDDVKEDQKLLRLSTGQTVTADFDGRVNVLSVEEGDEVSQGDALVQIADFSQMKVAFRVDEYDIGEVSVGQACTVTVTALERTFESRVDAIDYISSSNGNVAYYTATAYVDVDEGVLPGMQVTVTIPSEVAENVVILKVDALSFDFTNQAFVWMRDEAGELTQVYVTTGVSNGNYIEIAEGLQDGDVVYAEAKSDQSAADVFAGMFSSQRFNESGGPGGDMGNRPGGNNGGGSNGGGNWSGSGDGSRSRPERGN